MCQPAQSAGAINFSALFSFFITVRPKQLPTQHPPQSSHRASWGAGAITSLPALPSMHLLVEAPTIINHSTVLILAKTVCLNNYVNTLRCLGLIEMLPTLSAGRYLCTRDCHGAWAPACACSAPTCIHAHAHTCTQACLHTRRGTLSAQSQESSMVELTVNSISLGARKQ